MSAIDDIFGKMDQAAGSGSGQFFPVGLYTVELTEVEFREKGFKGTSVHFRFNTIESNNSEVSPGSARVVILKLDDPKWKDKTLADIKNMIFALGGLSPTALKVPELHPKEHALATRLFKASISEAFAAANNVSSTALIGKRCRLECSVKPGGKFTVHTWSPLPKATDAAA